MTLTAGLIALLLSFVAGQSSGCYYQDECDAFAMAAVTAHTALTIGVEYGDI